MLDGERDNLLKDSVEPEEEAAIFVWLVVGDVGSDRSTG